MKCPAVTGDPALFRPFACNLLPVALHGRWKKNLKHYASSPWFGALIAALSAADAYVFVVPNEPLIVAAAAARPKQWLALGLWATVGSALGAASVAWLVSIGSGWILHVLHAGKLAHSAWWHDSLVAVHHHGIWGLALISLSPLPQHIAVFIAGLVRMPVWKVFLGVLLGRLPKYLGTAYLSARAPEKLRKWHLVKKAA